MNKKSNLKAFSLIELSVIILVIGILVIGVTQGNRILLQSRISSATALTNSSPVSSIPNLKLWMESSDTSNIATGLFNAGTYGNPSDQDFVANWKDRNPQAINKIITSAAADINRPKYVQNGIGNLPSILFDGSNDYLFSTSPVPLSAGTDNFTYIAVWKMPAFSGVRVIFEQNNNASLSQGQRAAMIVINTWNYGFNGESNDAQITNYAMNLPNISTITVNDSGTVRVYTNSKINATNSSINPSIQNTSSNIFCVAAKCLSSKGEFFSGYISEIIVFDRVLKASEISDITEYLGKKYSIKLN